MRESPTSEVHSVRFPTSEVHSVRFPVPESGGLEQEAADGIYSRRPLLRRNCAGCPPYGAACSCAHYAGE
jgi:hypothetical protein